MEYRLIFTHFRFTFCIQIMMSSKLYKRELAAESLFLLLRWTETGVHRKIGTIKWLTFLKEESSFRTGHSLTYKSTAKPMGFWLIWLAVTYSRILSSQVMSKSKIYIGYYEFFWSKTNTQIYVPELAEAARLGYYRAYWGNLVCVCFQLLKELFQWNLQCNSWPPLPDI